MLPGFAGDGGPATAARLSFPEGVMTASNGDVYFADVANHRVRRVDAATGRIGTVAGSGVKGFSGDGGLATEARLSSPGRVWLDKDGNLLIADILNGRIRRVDAASATINTIAGSGDWGDGGPATNAILSVPGDIVYQDGKLYVADYGTRRIRCIDLKTHIISTVAGGGTHSEDGISATEVELALPEGIAIDPRGTLYIADNILNRVMQLDLRTGILRTIAGGGEMAAADGELARSVRLSMPSAMAVAPDGRLYLAEFGAQKLWVIDPGKDVMNSVPLPEAASLVPGAAVTSLSVNGEALYFLTHGSNTVRRLNLRDGVSKSFNIDTGPAARPGDSQVIDVSVHGHDVYLADPLGHRVLRIDADSSAVALIAGNGSEGFGGDGGPASEAMLFQPGAVAVNDDGSELYIADTKNHRIRRVYLQNGRVSQ